MCACAPVLRASCPSPLTRHASLTHSPCPTRKVAHVTPLLAAGVSARRGRRRLSHVCDFSAVFLRVAVGRVSTSQSEEPRTSHSALEVWHVRCGTRGWKADSGTAGRLFRAESGECGARMMNLECQCRMCVVWLFLHSAIAIQHGTHLYTRMAPHLCTKEQSSSLSCNHCRRLVISE